MDNKHVNLDLSSVIGMGISGPVLAFLTASLYAAFKGVFGWEEGAYAIIMLLMSALLASFPAMKSHYNPVLKFAMWPIATVIIFASAWGSSTGMSAGQEVIEGIGQPSLATAPSFPRQPDTTDVVVSSLGTWNDPSRTNARIRHVHQPEVLFNRDDDNLTHGRFFKRLKEL